MYFFCIARTLLLVSESISGSVKLKHSPMLLVQTLLVITSTSWKLRSTNGRPVQVWNRKRVRQREIMEMNLGWDIAVFCFELVKVRCLVWLLEGYKLGIGHSRCYNYSQLF